MADATKLHFMRIRKRGEPEWFDAQTDFRKLLPEVINMAIDAMEIRGEWNSGDVRYLRDCFRVFRIRTLEDAARVSVQTDEFLSALSKLPDRMLNELRTLVLRAMLCVYALFCRRDSSADQDALQAMLSYSFVDALGDSLSAETRAAISRDVSSRHSLLVQNRVEADGRVVCLEDDKWCTDRAKDVARRLMSASGDRSWDALSHACDRMFEEGGRSDMELMALALAFPSYRNPCLEVEIDGSPEGEGADAEGAGGAPSVPVDGGTIPDGG